MTEPAAMEPDAMQRDVVENAVKIAPKGRSLARPLGVFSLLAAALLAIPAAVLSPTARAQVVPPPIPPTPPDSFYLGTGTLAFTDYYLYSIDLMFWDYSTFLSTGIDLFNPAGSTIPGSSIMQLLTSIDTRLASLNASHDESLSNEDAAARLRMNNAQDQQTVRDRTPSFTTAGCRDVSTAMGTATAGSVAANAKQTSEQVQVNRYEVNQPDAVRQNLAALAASRGPLGVCTDADIANGRPGCVGRGPAPYPGADRNSMSLTQGPVRPKVPNAQMSSGAPNIPPTPTNYTLTPPQQQAADLFIANVAPQPLVQPPADTKAKTEAENYYLVQYNRYNARLSPVLDALTSIRGIHSAPGPFDIPQWASLPYLSTWNDPGTTQTYHQLFPNQVMPAIPSEMELLRYETMRQFEGVEAVAKRNSMSPKELSIQQVGVEALNARLLLAIYDRLEDIEKIQASMLAQQIDPLTYQGMNASLPSGVRKAGAQ